MSVRAYKIITKTTNDNPSFNLWNNRELIEMFELQDSYEEAMNDGGGTMELNVKDIKSVLKKYNWDKEPDNYIKKALQDDIKGLDDDDFVQYECY